MQHPRLLAGAGLAALAIGLVPLASSTAAPLGSRSANKTGLAAQRVTGTVNQLSWLPSDVAQGQPVRVIIEVAATSVAVAEGTALEAGQTFTAADESRTEAAATAAQAPLVAAIESSGGDVENRHVDAINAITATVPAGQLRAIAARTDVVNITPVRTYVRDNANSAAFTQTPQAWQGLGVTGAGVKVAIIDDGIDYTHADFGGSGDPADYAANDRTVVEAGSFPTAKVIGGYDFVGDDYDASSDDPALLVPVPDDDPLACGEHGTHVAGTTAGQGVLTDGSTYTGPYDTSLAAASFSVFPGAAPEASLLAYKVFGCDGSVDNAVLLAAIDQAVADGADVINMSLGSTFGYATDADAVAADNAAKAGVVVVISAGNEGDAAYLVGGPSTGHRVISVAALDATQSFPGAAVVGGAAPIDAINANGASLAGVSGTVVVLEDDAASESLACDTADFPTTVPPGPIVYVVRRGVCARVDKALNGEAVGGAAVIMVNNGDALPPFEGNVPGLTIPFIGVSALDGDAIDALAGTVVSFADNGIVPNPAYTAPADFTSGGPRSGDSGQKPDLIAPGVGVASASVSTGTQAENLSGTSMASPHVAGIAALVVQAHPDWSSAMVKAALVNTANAAAVGGYDQRLAGNGLVSPIAAINASGLLSAGRGEVAVNFGFEELEGSYTEVKELTLRNVTNQQITYQLATSFSGPSLGAVVSVWPSSVTVKPGKSKEIRVKISVSKAAAAAMPRADQGPGVVSIRGRVTATPTNGLPAISTPFLLVPHSRSEIEVTSKRLTTQSGAVSGLLKLRNGGIATGDADVYQLLLSDARDDESTLVDARAVGVQSFDDSGDQLLVFAVSNFDRFSSPGEQYADLYLDADGDGVLDHEVFIADSGIVEGGGSPNGIVSTYVVDLITGALSVYPAIAPTDGSVMIGFAYANWDLGMTPTSGPATLVGTTGSWLDGSIDDFPGAATFSPFDMQVSAGDFVTMPGGARVDLPVATRAAQPGETPAQGWLIVTLDDESGKSQSDIVRI